MTDKLVSPFFRTNRGIGQGSALFSILLGIIYCPYLSYFWNKKSNTNLFCSYSIIFSLYEQFCLMIKHNKSKVFHFSRTMKNYKPSSLDLRPLERHILQSKDNWKYLKFIFDRILTFHQHIHFYANKVLSNIKMLENSIRRLLLIHKWLLYKICIIPITLYGFQL